MDEPAIADDIVVSPCEFIEEARPPAPRWIDLQYNPLFHYLNRFDQQPSLRKAVRYGIGMVALNATAAGVAALFHYDGPAGVTGVIGSYGLPLLFLTPLWMVQFSAEVTQQLSRRISQLDLLRMTPMSDFEILSALFCSILFRARFAIALVAGTLVVMIGTAALQPDLWLNLVAIRAPLSIDYRQGDYLLNGLFWGLVGGGLALLNPIAAALGMATSLRLRRSQVVSPFAVIMMAALMLLLLAFFTLLIGQIGTSPRPNFGALLSACIVGPCIGSLLLIALYRYCLRYLTDVPG